MLKQIAVLSFSFLSISASSAMASECGPRTGGETIETREVMVGNETEGRAARSEIEAARKAKRAVSTVDLLGRELAVVAQTRISPTVHFWSGSETANAYVERYCSASSSKDAKCVSVCVRFSNYERP